MPQINNIDLTDYWTQWTEEQACVVVPEPPELIDADWRLGWE